MHKTFKSILREIESNPFQHYNLKFPDNFKDLPNIIIYGPPNSGKYYKAISILNQYRTTPDYLSQKKLELEINKSIEIFQSSEIHYEIDFSLLGTSAKSTWYSFYNHICDILMSKVNKTCVILIKNFHEIHEDLVHVFFSFMQKNSDYITIKYILLSQQLYFLPDNITSRCSIVKCKAQKRNKIQNNQNYNNNFVYYDNHIEECRRLISFMIDFKDTYIYKKKDSENQYKLLRDILYDILVKNYNIFCVLNYVSSKLIEMNVIIDHEKLIQDIYYFFKHYNNNYRPIYHLEKISFNIIDNLKN
tara:strand:- start:710 stop:1618 length:909 start_codon:yes stop_codon:yes gene_type:complete